MRLRDNLQPTDFADADCRVTQWCGFNHHRYSSYRIWVCKCGSYWFQRHEWARAGANSTDIDEWLFIGFWPRRQHAPHMHPAPELEGL